MASAHVLSVALALISGVARGLELVRASDRSTSVSPVKHQLAEIHELSEDIVDIDDSSDRSGDKTPLKGGDKAKTGGKAQTGVRKQADEKVQDFKLHAGSCSDNFMKDFAYIQSGATDVGPGQALGELFSFGYNGCGQLGLGASQDEYYDVAQRLPSSSAMWKEGGVLKDVVTTTMESIGYTYFIFEKAVFAVGSNQNGQLGVGNVSEAVWTPERVLIPATEKVTRIVTTAQLPHSFYTFFITESGKVYAAGDIPAGQLGSLGGDYKATPVLINMPEDMVVRGVVSEPDADNHFGIMFVLEDGDVHAYGADIIGRLGLGGFRPNAFALPGTPNPVMNVGKAKSVILMKTSAFILSLEGKVYTSGPSEWRQYSTTHTFKELDWSSGDKDCDILGPPVIRKIVAMKDHAFLITSQGRTYGVGIERWGRLGLHSSSKKCCIEKPDGATFVCQKPVPVMFLEGKRQDEEKLSARMGRENASPLSKENMFSRLISSVPTLKRTFNFPLEETQPAYLTKVIDIVPFEEHTYVIRASANPRWCKKCQSTLGCKDCVRVFATGRVDAEHLSCTSDGDHEVADPKLSVGKPLTEIAPAQKSNTEKATVTKFIASFGSLFFQTQEGEVHGCGDNRNYQLGISSPWEKAVIRSPRLLSEVNERGKVASIVARKDITYFLMEEGTVLAAGTKSARTFDASKLESNHLWLVHPPKREQEVTTTLSKAGDDDVDIGGDVDAEDDVKTNGEETDVLVPTRKGDKNDGRKDSKDLDWSSKVSEFDSTQDTDLHQASISGEITPTIMTNKLANKDGTIHVPVEAIVIDTKPKVDGLYEEGVSYEFRIDELTDNKGDDK